MDNSILVICIVVFIFYVFIYIPTAIYINRNKAIIKFSNGLKSIRLPIVTVNDGIKDLNMLVDTGSSESHIDFNAITEDVETSDINYECTCGTGSLKTTSKVVDIELRVGKRKKIVQRFIINKTISNALKQLSKDYGSPISGILGSDFLSKNKYVLDFAKQVVYPSKK